MQKAVSLFAICALVATVGCSKEQESKPAMTPASGSQPQERRWSEPSPDDSDTGWGESPAPMGRDSMDEPSMESNWGSAREHAALLAVMRCQREVRCDQIGPNKKYPSLEVCQSMMLEDASRELEKCPSGMDQEKVEECAAAIDTKGCELPGNTLSEFEECRSVSLCQ